MGLRINTNVQSITAQHQLGNNKEKLEGTQNRLSTGSRIVKPMDDAAGLAISENLRAGLRATGQDIPDRFLHASTTPESNTVNKNSLHQPGLCCSYKERAGHL